MSGRVSPGAKLVGRVDSPPVEVILVLPGKSVRNTAATDSATFRVTPWLVMVAVSSAGCLP